MAPISSSTSARFGSAEATCSSAAQQPTNNPQSTPRPRSRPSDARHPHAPLNTVPCTCYNCCCCCSCIAGVCSNTLCCSSDQHSCAVHMLTSICYEYPELSCIDQIPAAQTLLLLLLLTLQGAAAAAAVPLCRRRCCCCCCSAATKTRAPPRPLCEHCSPAGTVRVLCCSPRACMPLWPP